MLFLFEPLSHLLVISPSKFLGAEKIKLACHATISVSVFDPFGKFQLLRT